MAKGKKISEVDIIKEVGSICACNSTLAFSQMIGRSILLESPQLELVNSDNLEQKLKCKESIVIGVHTQLLSGIVGKTSLIFTEKSAFEFVSIFSSKEKHTVGFLTELGVSTIKEIGNVVMSAYAGAMSLLLNVSVVQSIPILSSGPINEVIMFGFTSMRENESLFVHTMFFKDNERKINGSFYLMLSPETAAQITSLMRKELMLFKKNKRSITGDSIL